MRPKPGDEIAPAATFAMRFVGCFALLALGLVCGIGVAIGMALT